MTVLRVQNVFQNVSVRKMRVLTGGVKNLGKYTLMEGRCLYLFCIKDGGKFD